MDELAWWYASRTLKLDGKVLQFSFEASQLVINWKVSDGNHQSVKLIKYFQHLHRQIRGFCSCSLNKTLPATVQDAKAALPKSR